MAQRFHNPGLLGSASGADSDLMACLGTSGLLTHGPPAEAVALGRDDLALGQKHPTVGAIDVASIAFLGAGGLLGIPKLRVGVGKLHRQLFHIAWFLSIDLFVCHCHIRVLASPFLYRKGQGRCRRFRGNCIPREIAKGHRASCFHAGGIVAGNLNVLQLQCSSMVSDHDQAIVGRQIHALCILGVTTTVISCSPSSTTASDMGAAAWSIEGATLAIVK